MSGDPNSTSHFPEIKGIERIDDAEWAFYRDVIEAIRGVGQPFALGGTFASVYYTGIFRDTKDLDFFILPEARQQFIEALSSLGLTDYHDVEPYDRKWIYRGTKDGYIIDLIWDMANYRANLDSEWVTCGPMVDIRGEFVRILPIEELIWNKIYILQRPRCDWTDVLNLLYIRIEEIDWKRLLQKLEPDEYLFAGVLSVFLWMCPGRAKLIPTFVWDWVGMKMPQFNGEPEYIRHRVDLLDSRPWFIPTLKEGEEPFAPVIINK